MRVHAVFAATAAAFFVLATGTHAQIAAETAAVQVQAPGAITSAPADPTAKPPYGIGVKRPLVAAACKGCPWGALAYAITAAMQPYGYDVQVCWVCWSSYGPREVADKTKPTMPPGDNLPWYIEPPPDGVPDFGITSDMNLTDLYLGRGAYANDHKPRKNVRVVATVLQPNYMLIAVSAKSGIKSLSDIKNRTEPTRIWVDGNQATQVILKYYGIDEKLLNSKGGGFIHPLMIEREERASADVYIGGAVLANTPEQHTWYEVSQFADLKFLQMDDQLIDQLAQIPGFNRGLVPMGYLRGVDHRIPTVIRDRHVIYVRDDAPDDFAYTLAKALDEHQDEFRKLAQPYYYDIRQVGISEVVPLHPGALKYYRERGYIK
jgi:TRAP transporter TAXI family solute receptor